jgi:hypothetical protein
MLSEREEKFIAYWSVNRENEKKSFRQFLKGLSTGIIIGVAIIILLSIGWYERANMEANVWLSPTVTIVAVISIAVFMAYFYRNYQWEQKEQQYLELLAKKKRIEAKNNAAAKKS